MVQARRQASSSPPEAILLVLAPCQTHPAFQHDHTLQMGGFLGPGGYRASPQPTGPTSSTTCPASKSGDATNVGMEEKGGVIATQDPALPAAR